MSEELKEKEQQLRDRLTSRKEEHKLRNRLKSRQEERRRSQSMEKEVEPKKMNGRNHSQDHNQRRHEHRPRDRDQRPHDKRRYGGDDKLPRRSPYGRGNPPPPPRRRDDRHSPRGPPPYDPRYAPPPADAFYHAPPYSRRPPPPNGDIDPFGRARPHPRSRSRSRDRSVSSVGSSDVSSASSRHSSPSSRSSKSHSTASSSRSSRSSRSSSSSSGSSSSYSSSSALSTSPMAENSEFTKDQRTIFINQLIMRTTERDLRHYFKEQGMRIIGISMLRDKKTGRHKGCAYVELRHLEDVPKAVALSGQPPPFQRFPILVKASEAEKNYSAPKPLVLDNSVTSNVNIQRVYIGNLEPTVSQEQLMALFEPFGSLQKVALQTANGISKGFAFLTFGDASSAYLAIQTMSGQTLLGRGLKTGWAQRAGEQSEDFPSNASQRAQQAYQRLGQINLGLMPSSTTIASNGAYSAPASTHPNSSNNSGVGTVAEARASLAAVAASRTIVPPTLPMTAVTGTLSASPSMAAASDPKTIGNASHPTPYLHVRNMFDKDQETEPNWAQEIQLDFEDESRKFGALRQVKVLAEQPGGQIYCQFETVAGATACANALAGRWFDRRQIRVEFVPQSEFESA